MYGERLQECVDVLFSFDMRNCQNCIFCSNGRNLSYCIENKPCTKEEFENKKAEILKNYDSVEGAKKKYAEIHDRAIVKYAFATKCNNTTGDYIYNCYDGVKIFDAIVGLLLSINESIPNLKDRFYLCIVSSHGKLDPTTTHQVSSTNGHPNALPQIAQLPPQSFSFNGMKRVTNIR